MSLPETKSDVLLDAWDFQGRPADRSKTGGWASAAMILCKYNHKSKVLEKKLPTIYMLKTTIATF